MKRWCYPVKLIRTRTWERYLAEVDELETKTEHLNQKLDIAMATVLQLKSEVSRLSLRIKQESKESDK